MADDWTAVPRQPIVDDWQAVGDAPKAPIAAPAAAAPKMSDMDRFGSGLIDPIVGGAQLLSHAMPQAASDAVNRANNWMADQGVPLAKIPEGGMDQVVREREAAITAGTPTVTPRTETKLDAEGRASHVPVASKRPPIDIPRLAGRAASPINYLPSIGPGGTLARSVLGGGLAGALEPVQSDDFWKEKGKQTAVGAVAGAGTDVVGRAVARAITPEFRASSQRMLDEGVVLSPGQMAGGVARRGEEAAKSVPLLGSAIRGAEGRTLDSFNRATANQALRPIGVKVPDNLNGREVIEFGQRTLSDRYDAVLSQVSFRADQTMANDIRSLSQLVSEMPRTQREQFNAVLTNRLMQRLQPTGTMDGVTLKQVESELSNFGRQMRSSSDAAQRQLGHAIDEMSGIIRDTLRRQNPAQAAELGAIDQAYAMFTRVEGAATHRAGGNGRFTPGDLLSSVRSADRTVRKRAFARGDALLQDWAEDAGRVISNHMPDSGSPERLMWDAGGVLGGWALKPEIPMALGAFSAPYTRPGMAAGNVYATGAMGPRGAVSSAIRGATPFVSPLDATLADDRLLGKTSVSR